MAHWGFNKKIHLQFRKCRKCRFDPWVGKIPWRRKWQPALVFLPGESYKQRSLEHYSPRGHKESDTTERLKNSIKIWSISPSSLVYLRWNRTFLASWPHFLPYFLPFSISSVLLPFPGNGTFPDDSTLHESFPSQISTALNSKSHRLALNCSPHESFPSQISTALNSKSHRLTLNCSLIIQCMINLLPSYVIKCLMAKISFISSKPEVLQMETSWQNHPDECD